jgi:hypothetical protein
MARLGFQVFWLKLLPPTTFAVTTELSSRPERTRISYFALLARSTCAALSKESRMQIINATGLNRKSGGASWRDLCVDALSWKFSFLQSVAQRRDLRLRLGLIYDRSKGMA